MQTLKFYLPASLMLGSLLCVSAHAGNLLNNGSFENTDGTFANSGIGGDTGVMDLLPGATTIPGWTVADGGSGHDIAWLVNGNNYGLTASDGKYFLDLTGYDNSPAYSGVKQDVTTIAGQKYQLSFDVGEDGVGGALGGPVAVSATAMDGGTDLSQTAGNSLVGTGNLWQSFSYTFTASSASTEITFLGSAGADYIGLDNASLTTASAVPDDASTLGLALIALAAALACARARSGRLGAAVLR